MKLKQGVWGGGEGTSATVAVVGSCKVIIFPLEMMATLRSLVITLGTATLEEVSSEEDSDIHVSSDPR